MRKISSDSSWRTYATPVSELEPHKRPKKEVEPRHIPHVVVPVAVADARTFVHDALRGTNLITPVASALSGWMFFEPHLRYTAVDAAHTRIELDVVGKSPGAETLLFVQRRTQIHRFFVAIQDELDRRDRWRPNLPTDDPPSRTSD